MLIAEYLKKRAFQKQWREKNGHNETVPLNRFDQSCVSVGNYTYGGLFVLTFKQGPKLKIGHFCSIGPEVKFLLSSDHCFTHPSTFPFRAKFLPDHPWEGESKGDIVVEDDAWLGLGATVLSGVTIGQGAVIAAGAVVTRDVPPYAIAAGAPARVVKYRFPEETVRALLEIDYGSLDRQTALQHLDSLYRDVTDPEPLSWMPRKRPGR